MAVLRIGTRGSRLALWQAHYLQDQLKQLGVESELEIIKTKGDRIQHLSLDKLEGKGFFTKEIEDALIVGRVHVAVHSMKDMPTEQPEGLCLTAVSYRETPNDQLLIRADRAEQGRPLQLPSQAVVGTSSSRRKAQLLDLAPEIVLKDIRGNVPTRIQKLRDGQFDAIVLAAAGIERLDLDLEGLVSIKMHTSEFVPAPAQGVLAFQTRSNDLETRRLFKKLHKSDVSKCTNVERTVLKNLDGGCHTPIGVYCERDANGAFTVNAAYATAWDQPVKRVMLSSTTTAGLAERVLAEIQ